MKLEFVVVTKKTIFAVDDEPAMQDIYTEMFGDDFEIFCYEHPAEMLHKADELRPDLAIIDIGLSGMDGYQLCDALKQKDGMRDIPVIFVSGRDYSQDKGRAFFSGGAEYLTKPVRVSSLRAAVNRLVQ